MIKGSILQKDRTPYNIYALNNRESTKYVSPKRNNRITRKSDESVIIVRAFNTPLSQMHIPSRQNVIKDTVKLNVINNQT